ncbi:hypothetical protein TWF694_009277 [Orbilia ellipsospora]|uniref:RBR-type E3 ubiquitin transferase n=1 Tax=Orbilia ellipsospora TaxID=2528407 RepID=A0AAV9XHT7_9PEZI
MRTRTIRQSLLRKDPSTSAEAAQAILALANAIGWTDTKKRRAGLIFPKEKATKCSICGDTFLGYELERLNCTHRHCPDCLQGNYKSVLNSPESYPPKCCSALPLASTCHVLTDEEMRAILEMKDNYESSKIIPCFSCQGDIYLSDMTKDAAYCLKCTKLTCMTCRKEMHNDLCPEDPDTETLKSLAKEEGWTQCPKCSRLIHRTGGCNSMICVCKTNFCFRCGSGFPCKCFGIPRTNPSMPDLKSKAEISFGSAFSVGSSSRKAGYKERLNNKILKDYHRSAVKNDQNQKFQLKDLKVKRKEKAKEIEAAKEVIRLRVKMNELAQVEKARKKELRLKAMDNDGSLVDTRRVIVTRRNVYVANEEPMALDDFTPVGKRTRSQRS